MPITEKLFADWISRKCKRQKLSKKLIPKNTPYCYTIKKGKRILCPYWFHINGLPEQESGFCAYLGKSDFDLNRTKKVKVTYVKGKKVKNAKWQTPFEVGLPMSLLFDQCKECGVSDKLPRGSNVD